MTKSKSRLEIASIDQALIRIFEGQTQDLRLIDRELGAHYLLRQSQTHVQQIEELLRYSILGVVWRGLARSLTQAMSLTGKKNDVNKWFSCLHMKAYGK